jgi:glycosyltransferase involved in cell wall biosynthesis
MPYNPVLAIVIPVYNEEASLVTLLQDWQAVFNATGEPYKIILIDDGSRDKSLQLLKTLAESNPVLDVHTQANAGHGPAILKGYRLALSAEWVFQIDSDHQLDTTAFATLWANRQDFDLLIAQRQEKNATFMRLCVSSLSRAIVQLCYGEGVRDVNTPYRLMRASQMGQVLDRIPDESFAPNVLLTGWFIAEKKRIFTTTTELRKDIDLRVSKMNRYFLLGVLRSALQTLRFRQKL